MTTSYKLELNTIPYVKTTLNNKYGLAKTINSQNFPILQNITSYHLEIYDNSMRTIHMHNNCNELGFLVKGKIQVIIYFDDLYPTVFTVEKGNIWFIPKGFPHCLNNIDDGISEMFVGFSSDSPDSIDISVMIGSMPTLLKNTYDIGSNIHTLLKNLEPPTENYIYCPLPKKYLNIKNTINSQYVYDLNAIKSPVKIVNSKNWEILKNSGISIGRFIFNPLEISSTLWNVGANCLYIILSGNLDIFIPEKNTLLKHNYFFVPTSMLHTVSNPNISEICEFIVFFSCSDNCKMLTLQNTLSFFGEELSSYNLVNKYFIPQMYMNN